MLATSTRRPRSPAALLGLVALVANGCTGSIPNKNGGDGGGVNPDGGVPFEPVSAAVYIPKVKNLLTGLPAADAEVAAVTADPTALPGLIDTWMALPQFQSRMMDFMRNAFQQNQVDYNTLEVNLGGAGANNFGVNNAYMARFERSVMDSFPMTMWELISEGRPFTDGLTTNRYMLTTAMMTLMEYADERATNDLDQTTDRLAARQALPGFTLDPKTTATLEQTLTVGDPNYMVWKDPIAIPAGCTATPPVVYTNLATGDKGAGNYRTLVQFIFGSGTYLPCYPVGSQQATRPPTLTDADWTDWHMVTIHPLDASHLNTEPVFWDIIKARAATDMYLHTTHLGFSGTLAFAANWGTNSSNEMRVTANQALIVGIGQSINGENTVANFPVNATDSAHATDPACSGCHGQLDPMKQYFRQSWSLYYHDQTDTSQLNIQAGFNIDTSTPSTGTGIADLMTTMANHPRYPLAWAQKLVFWANSTTAEITDPELVRIAGEFTKSNFDFKTLVRETFSSPLVTFAKVTQTTSDNGVILSIARRDQMCTSLSNRLGLPDVCGQSTPAPTSAQTQVAGRALMLPVDTYYRAYALPSLPTNPDLFFRQSTESMCGLIAAQVIDTKTGVSRYDSTQPTPAIADMVATVMGIPPSDPRSAQAIQILTDHFTAASATAGIKATDALTSTFVLACIAPSSVIVGL